MAGTTPVRHQPTILLVEDDEAVRDLMTKNLVGHGYLVLTAASTHDALESLRAPLSEIDLVLLDVHLPDLSGIELCSRIREMNPALPVVVCTGLADADEEAELLKIGISHYFRKPFVMRELLAAVDGAIAGGPSARPILK